MLCVDGLHIRLGGFRLERVSFTVARGDYFVLLGASGVGKTVLLEALAGLTPLRGGRITLGERDISSARIQERRLGLVYQDQALFPHLNVEQNIVYGACSLGLSGADLKTLVRGLAAQVGVEDLLHRYPGTLSGGEAQRVALARALAMRPRCLLLDEPLSALDITARAGMRALLRKLHRQGQTVVHVTHDYEEALALATRVGILENGTIVQTGPPAEVFQHPKSEFVARFIGIRNVFPGILEAREDANRDTAVVAVGELRLTVLTDAAPGAGMLLVRSEDVTLSSAPSDSSAQNCFPGVVTDVAPARLGLEVYVDIGVEVAALVTGASAERLHLKPGVSVWLSFKASAARFLEA